MAQEQRPRTLTLFNPGRITATAAVHKRAKERQPFAAWMVMCLRRHIAGDWGDMEKSDMSANDTAVLNGNERIFSSYTNSNGLKLWIITEADRSATTILFPEDH